MVTGTNTTDYILDGANVIQEKLNGSVNARYLWGVRGPEYRRDASGSYEWYVYDGLGSVIGTVDNHGNILSTRKCDVYGAVRGSSGPSGTRHKFVGSLGHPSEEETGLIYMRARYYDPVTGRFESEDPAKQGVNWYVYCIDNPVNSLDTDGQLAMYPLGAALASFIWFVWHFQFSDNSINDGLRLAWGAVAAYLMYLGNNPNSVFFKFKEVRELLKSYEVAAGSNAYVATIVGFYVGYNLFLLWVMDELEAP